jgi:peptidoglycan/LPS O-acetylase OafA/YrhL
MPATISPPSGTATYHPPDPAPSGAPRAEGEVMPQLDSIRALALLAVLFTHYMPVAAALVPIGPMALQSFFVLSGFLITGILLRCRGLVDDEGQPLGATLRRFYLRRSLRIIPLYYVALLIAWTFDISGVRRTIGWHAAYTSNVLVALTNDWQGYLAHFWTLSVEEQFYLVWPLVILLVPRRALAPVIAGIIALGPAFRIVLDGAGLPWLTVYTLTPGSFDALGVGSLMAVAWLGRRRDTGAPRWLRGAALGGVAYLALYLGSWWLPIPKLPGRLPEIVALTALDAVCGWLVWRTAAGWRGHTGRLLGWGPLRSLGRISYGVYVLHLFVPLGIAHILVRLGGPPLDLGLMRFLICTPATIAVAALSWRLLERPINDLKSHVPYRIAPRGRPTPTG